MTHSTLPARRTKRYFSLSATLITILVMTALSWISSKTVNYTYDNTYQIKKAAYTNFTTSYEYDEFRGAPYLIIAAMD